MKAIALAVLMSAGAIAGQALGAQDFSRVRCEDPQAKPIIIKLMAGLRFEDGRSFASEGLSADSILSISTLSASRDKLVCKLVVSLGFRGMSLPIRGKLTFRQFPNGKLAADWSPLS
jgi:hypothetical protein